MTDHTLPRAIEPATSPSADPTLRPDQVPPPPDAATLQAEHPRGGNDRWPNLPESGYTMHGFELLRELGRGSFARVYLARQTDLGRLVALKVSPNLGQEARTLAGLEHDHIVRVFSEQVDPATDLRLLCMQYVPGTTLSCVIDALHARPGSTLAGQAILDLVDFQNADPVPLDLAALRDRERLAGLDLLEAACWMGARLAEALAYAHGRGVLHRDIKPANILVNRYGRPLLADFNVSAASPPPRRDAPEPSRGLDKGSVGGTIPYMAPEHIDAFNPDNFTAAEAVDARSDLYSLGVVLFEFLTGRLPFDWPAPGPTDEVLQELADRRRAGPPPLDPGIGAPAMLERILARCLAGKPSQRYPCAADLAADLDSCRKMLRVQRELPAGSVVTRLSLGSPFLVAACLVVLPNVLATAANIGYNAARIVGRFSAAQQHAFLLVTVGYNLVIYPITVGLYARQLWPLVRLWRQLARPGPLDALAVHAARRRALRIPWWVATLSAGGWLLGGVVFPLGIYLGTGELERRDAGHFLISFTVAGLIATTYAVMAIEYVVVRVLYPGLWLDARNLRSVAAEELRPMERRVIAWQVLAVLIPLVGAGLMTLVGPETFDAAEYRTFRLLVTGLLGLGSVGLGLALLTAGLVRRTIAVLTAGTPYPQGRPGPHGTSPRAAPAGSSVRRPRRGPPSPT